MAQMHFYVSDSIAERLRARAQSLGLTVSRYLASVVLRDLGKGWPKGYFEEVAGGWQGKPLRRSPQGAYEERGEL